jgi:hypothetical protein
MASAFHAITKTNVSTDVLNNTKELDYHGRAVLCIFYTNYRENPVAHGIMQIKTSTSQTKQLGVVV